MYKCFVKDKKTGKEYNIKLRTLAILRLVPMLSLIAYGVFVSLIIGPIILVFGLSGNVLVGAFLIAYTVEMFSWIAKIPSIGQGFQLIFTIIAYPTFINIIADAIKFEYDRNAINSKTKEISIAIENNREWQEKISKPVFHSRRNMVCA